MELGGGEGEFGGHALIMDHANSGSEFPNSPAPRNSPNYPGISCSWQTFGKEREKKPFISYSGGGPVNGERLVGLVF